MTEQQARRLAEENRVLREALEKAREIGFNEGQR